MASDLLPAPADNATRHRMDALDMARGVALVAMATYHFTWDLEFFGYVEPGMTAVGGWKLFARCIASSFLLLAGVSLFLAHGRAIRWPGFAKRLAMVAGAAAAISAASYFFSPEAPIFFGILHQIALASVLGLVFLRVPAPLTLLVAVGVLVAPLYLRSEVFDHPALWWVGLSLQNPRSNDYVPLFPWFAAVLTGIALAKIAAKAGGFARIGAWRFGNWAKPLAFGGRHSLAVYLIHQPGLIASIWLFSQIFPAEILPQDVRFSASCERSCEESRDTAFCPRYCACMLDALQPDGRLDALFANDQSAELRAYVGEMASTCTISTDSKMLEETPP